MLKNIEISKTVPIPLKKEEISKIIAFLCKYYEVELVSLAINFISSEQIREINVKYLKHDYETDVITFNYTGSNSALDGEIFISPEEAALNAKRYKKAFDDELRRLLIHAFLHLLGIDDKTPAEKRKMRNLETKLLHHINNELLSVK